MIAYLVDALIFKDGNALPYAGLWFYSLKKRTCVLI